MHGLIQDAKFARQEGCAAFTVSATARGVVKHYIAQQAENHRRCPFRDLLHGTGIAFDERYLD